MADKIVKLVDKNSNNLYPVAGSVIDNAVSTGAISSQAVTNPKIENGAVNGVENNATAIGAAKLALDTVGTPNLRDASVTSDKIDFTTLAYGSSRYAQNQTIPVKTSTRVLFPNNVVTDTEGVTYDNGVFTIQKAGWWFISAGIGGAEFGGDSTCSIWVNGAEVKVNRSWASGDTGANSQATYVVTATCYKLNVGDTVEARAYSIREMNINSRVRGNIDMCLISPTA